jgi:hypothetical protein
MINLSKIPDKLIYAEAARRRAQKREYTLKDDPATAETRRKQREYRAERRKAGKDK